MDRIVNSLIIFKTFLIQQVGMCNGGLETGQIDHILPIYSTIGVNETKLPHINYIKLYSFLNVSVCSTIYTYHFNRVMNAVPVMWWRQNILPIIQFV